MAAQAPKGLEAKGRRLWREIVTMYELRADELDTLEDICREADLIVRLEAELDGAELVVKGSQGQDVANPIVSEIRQHRTTKKTLWTSLKLPDEGNATAGNQQREAAQTRWAQTRGKGA